MTLRLRLDVVQFRRRHLTIHLRSTRHHFRHSSARELRLLRHNVLLTIAHPNARLGLARRHLPTLIHVTRTASRVPMPLHALPFHGFRRMTHSPMRGPFQLVRDSILLHHRTFRFPRPFRTTIRQLLNASQRRRANRCRTRRRRYVRRYHLHLSTWLCCFRGPFCCFRSFRRSFPTPIQRSSIKSQSPFPIS